MERHCRRSSSIRQAHQKKHHQHRAEKDADDARKLVGALVGDALDGAMGKAETAQESRDRAGKPR